MELTGFDFREYYLTEISRQLKHNMVTDIAKDADIPYAIAEALLELCTIRFGDREV